MSAREYDLLKQELDEIVTTAERFPKSVRELVYRSLVEALLRTKDSDMQASMNDEQEVATRQQHYLSDENVMSAEMKSAFSSHLEKYEGITLNDMEFCALVARFFIREISPDQRVEFIGPELLMASVRVADRQRQPANAATTLNNAKNLGGYLKSKKSKGKGVYDITDKGMEMLDEKLGRIHDE